MSRQSSVRHPFRVLALRLAVVAALTAGGIYWISPLLDPWFWLALVAYVTGWAPAIWVVLELEKRWGWRS